MNRRRNDNSNRRHASDVARSGGREVLIDGYNLMHVTRFKPVGNSEGELRRCREGLLSMLAKCLPSSRYRRITVVFDSSNAPGHLPDQMSWRHIEVLFAREQNSADDQIALMISQHSTPKQLVVVSSDHRVQIAANRRRAIWVDSDPWIEAILDQNELAEASDREQNANPKLAERDKDPAPRETPDLSSDELSDFIRTMNEPISLDDEKKRPAGSRDSGSLDAGSQDDEFENPFPEGYFDDLEDE